MLHLFGIPNCDTVKKARAFLEKNTLSFEFVDFKKNPPTADQIQLWAKSFGALPVNKKGQTYKKFSAEYEALSEKQQIGFLTQHSSMIKRPILQKDETVLSFGFAEADFSKALGL